MSQPKRDHVILPLPVCEKRFSLVPRPLIGQPGTRFWSRGPKDIMVPSPDLLGGETPLPGSLFRCHRTSVLTGTRFQVQRPTDFRPGTRSRGRRDRRYPNNTRDSTTSVLRVTADSDAWGQNILEQFDQRIKDIIWLILCCQDKRPSQNALARTRRNSLGRTRQRKRGSGMSHAAVKATFTHTHTHTHTRARTHTHTHTESLECPHPPTRMYVPHTHTHVHTHTHTRTYHTHTHTHTHTCY